MPGFGDDVVLAARAACVADESPIFILEHFNAEASDVSSQLMQHTRAIQYWTLPNVEYDVGIAEPELCLALKEFMLHGAYPSGTGSDGVALMGRAHLCAEMLHQQNFVDKFDTGK